MKNFLSRFLLPGTTIFMISLLMGCSSHRIVSVWDVHHTYTPSYNRIMVVAILPDEDSLTRDNIEKSFVNALSGLGYHAVSSASEFGRKGLSNLTDDETYIKLCNYGIDAVVTVALVNEAKDTEHAPVGSHTYRNNFFYRRIFDYKTLLTQPGDGDEKYFWESIFFDLKSLEVATAVQTVPTSRPAQLKMRNELAKRIVGRMEEEQVIKKHKSQPKAF